MLRVERIGKRLASFANLKPRPLDEFYELSDFIANSPAEFFGEIGESLLLVTNGLRTGEDAESYVDALGVDRSGAATVVIIVPDGDGSPLTRAIHSASRIAAWERDEFLRRIGAGKTQELRTFLAENFRDLNKRQRVILIAESYSRELLGTASWLSGSYGVDIACVEVTLAFDAASGDEFLSCRLVSSRPEIETPEPEKVEPVAEAAPEEPEVGPEPFEEEGDLDEPADLFLDSLPEPGEMPNDLFGSAEEEPKQEPEPVAAPAYSPEGRRVDRRTEFSSPGMTVHYAGRDMRAGLVDYSRHGVGLTMHSPLPIGMSIIVKGKLSWGDTEVELEKRGRVVHCSFLGQAFRLGVLFTPLESAAA